MTKKIPLQNGMFALIDDEDFEKVNEFNWTYALSDGYPLIFSNYIGNNKEILKLSRFILGLEKSNNDYVFHKNKNDFDFRKNNLIVSDRKGWVRKSKGWKNSSSKYKGVSWNKALSKWQAGIKVQGKRKHLGYFSLEAEAALAYNKAAIQFFGKNSYQNNIEESNNAEVLVISPIKERRLSRKRKKASSKFKGVDYHNSLWRARLTFKGKTYELGTFKNEIEAAEAYNEAAIKYYGANAILNVTKDGAKNEFNWGK